MTFQILALSGGGFMGLFTASVLAELEEQLGRPIATCFDMIAGTSVGGIIGLGLASGTTATDIRDAFVQEGPNIFAVTPPPKGDLATYVKLVRMAHRPLYSPAPLRKVIVKLVGDRLMGDLRRRIVVPTVNLTKGGVQLFKTSHHPTFGRDWKVPVLDVALATSAAPSYFPVHTIGGQLYADGGLCANSPDQIAIHEACQYCDQTLDEVAVLSIGTTTASFAWSKAAGTDLGLVGWLKDQKLTRAMIGAQQALVNDMTRHMLGKRYLRIDHDPSASQQENLALDVASPVAISDLQGMAQIAVQRVTGTSALQTMMQHASPEQNFLKAE